MTGSGPLAGDIQAKRYKLDAAKIAHLHSYIAIAVLILAVGLLAQLRNTVPAQTYTDNYQDLIQNPQIEAIIISATPESTHYPMARDALKAGKHVFLEKPIAIELSEADELITLAQQKNLKFTIGYSQRFNPKYAYVKKALRDGVIGKAVSVLVSRHITRSLGKKISGRIKLSPAAMESTHDLDFVLCEIGGTVGDIESLPFLEAIRQMRKDVGRTNVLYVHVTLLPELAATGELKTKPTQHSVKELRSIGIQPDVVEYMKVGWTRPQLEGLLTAMAARPRDILVRMLRNLKALFAEHPHWQQFLNVQQRLVMLLPDEVSERRDRGLAYAQLDCPQAALEDLEAYLAQCPQASDADTLRQQLPELRAASRRLN